ncbi:MAG: response regulator [Anaerolineae bacterium]|nr:response regulator [Anaerolineae bacterium]
MQKAKVMIADDSFESVELLRALLSDQGYEIVVAFDGEEALAKAREETPDLLLLDIMMPKMDGYEVCRRLKADPHTARIPILMLSARGAIPDRVKGLDLGAEDYFTKPFNLKELVARVQARLRAKHREDDLLDTERRVRDTFQRYVSTRVVEKLLRNPERVELGGVEQEVTILFADLRGFTALAEHLPPERLIGVLNGYLTAGAQPILEHDGTINQYAGDEIMAIFNAPLRQDDHVLRAVKAGLAIHQRLRTYHATLEPELRLNCGVGIGTGQAVVGNVGTPQIMNYTAVGDVVNLAKRLEESAQGGQVLIGANSYQHVRDLVVVRSLPPLTVKGREEPVAVYEVLGLKT